MSEGYTSTLTLLPEDYGLGDLFSSESLGLDVPKTSFNFDSYKSGFDLGNSSTPWYQNGSAMQGYAGLAGALLQAAALPSQMKTAKLQQNALKQNIEHAKQDQARRNTAINNINKKVI